MGAYTIIFPLYMLIVALATLVSNGMSGILARNLGAGDLANAARVCVGAHGMAPFVNHALIVSYLVFGRAITLALASGSTELADMSQTYPAITTFMSPLAFVLAVISDALHNECGVGFLAAFMGQSAICAASPVIEGLTVILTLTFCAQTTRVLGFRNGLFTAPNSLRIPLDK